MNIQRSTLDARHSGRTILLLALAVAVVTICVHWPCVHNGFLNWDDTDYIGKAAELHRVSPATLRWMFTALFLGNYHPLTWLSHVLDYQVWGLNPWGHHATSVALHGLNAAGVVVVVWMLGRALTGVTSGERLALAVAVGLVFGVHPLQVESVAWVSERKTVLCAFFSLLSLCAYVQSTWEPARPVWRWATAAFFVAALLAKAMAMTLPFVMLAVDFCSLRQHETVGWRRLWKEKLWLIGLGAVDLVLTVIAQAKTGAVMTIHAQNVMERCLIAARAFIFYLWKLVWPAWLSPFYPLGGDISLRRAEFLMPTVLVVLISALAFRFRKRAPALLAAWCAYLALLVPVSGLLQVGSQSVADRYAYLSMLAPLLALGWGGVWLWRRARRPGRVVLLGLVCGEFIFFVANTRQQIPVWRDSETLWSAVLGHFPRSSVAQGHLAWDLAEQGRFEEALSYARVSLAALPDYPVARYVLEKACSELASVRIERRQFSEALPYAEQLLELDATNSSARAMIGLIDLKTHRVAESIRELQQALQLNPDLPATRYNLACAYSRAGRFAEACDTLQTLLTTQPQFVRLAVRDSEFNGLRAEAVYNERFQALLGGAQAP